MDLEKGGRGAIERMVEAYGFTTRQALCDQLGVSKGTLSNRYMRDSFPADWVIQCSLETGASLKWLTSGIGVMFENVRTDITELPRKKIIDGKIYDSNFYFFDKAFLPNGMKKPFILEIENKKFIADEKYVEIKDGTWVLDMDGTIVVKDIFKLPAGKIRVSDSNISFDCTPDDIKIIAKVVCVAIYITQ
ncbi:MULTISPECIES: phage repressor protein CI [Serratia]|uniref:phage repressor protein CI n=1 Tax=Serratia TaxID=613 RepID=UPI000CE2ADF0|nr:phage repressor protein CI [Serratia marcescens]AVD62416.1 phage repressor protein [Serratia marcescens]ELL0332382.1 phage repressor protein CI [Serratia marcescens]MBH2548939.1 phage repressor protein CI [Serratia marcescens]